MTPDEVYELVDHRTDRMLFWLVIVVVMVSAKLLAEVIRGAIEVVIWRRVIALLRETKVLTRIAQQEGNLTERQTVRAESIVAQAQEVASKLAPTRAQTEEHIIEEVRKVPDATAKKLSESGIFKGDQT